MKLIPAYAPFETHEILDALRFYRDNQIKEVFERKVKAFLHTKNYITVGSGRRALYTGLKALQIGRGDEVIFPAFTTNIVPLVIKESGATPVPADVNMDDYNLDTASVKERITSRTKAVLTVHTFGYPSDVTPLQQLCEDHHLHFIEDAAPAFGAAYKGTPVGTLGSFSILSYGFGKSFSLGGGGGITACEKDLFRKIRRMALPGRHKSSVPFLTLMAGFILLSNPYLYHAVGCHLKNERVSRQYDSYKQQIFDERDIPRLAYALGVQKLETREFEKRRKIALHYIHTLKGYNIFLPVEKKGRHSVYTFFSVRAPSESVRDALCQKMRDSGVEPLIPAHGYPVSESLYPSRFHNTIPRSELLSKTLFTIPVHTKIPEEKLTQIFDSVA